MKKIAIVLLAAGNSTRYQGIKLLDRINGKQMYQHILDILEDINAAPKIIVTQYREIQEEAIKHGFETVLNQQPELGISHSLQLGLTTAMNRDSELDGVLFGVCDQPYLKQTTIKRLVHAYLGSEKCNAGISYEGELGNPCIIGRKYFDELNALTGDVGGKKIVLKYPEDVEEVPVMDVQELSDIDYRIDNDK